MCVTRQEIFERIAAATDAAGKTTTTPERIATELHAKADTMRYHLDSLQECELIRRQADGSIRITITGEELLALDIDDSVVIDLPQEH